MADSTDVYKIPYNIVYLMERIVEDADYICEMAMAMRDTETATDAAIAKIDIVCAEMRNKTQKALRMSSLINKEIDNG